MPVKGLTQAEIDAATAATIAAGGKSTDRANRLPGETATEANARITAGYRNQERPELTETGKQLGATIEFVRKGAGGVGKYQEVYGFGTPIPTERTTAYGNVYDAQGNLISGSGLKTPPVSEETLKSVAESNAAAEAKIRAEESAKLKARFMAEGLSEADALKKVDEFWKEASAAYARGYEIDENGNQIPMYGSAGSGFFGPSTTKTTDPNRPIGTPPAFVYDPVSKTYKMPAKPTKAGNWVWDNNSGWTNTLVNPGATGFEAGSEKTLAVDTFKNTLALFFGAKEMSQPWANALFKTVSSYYKTGATIDESLNLALQDARNKPELADFTKRFAGVFALQDRRAAGEAVDVPTIAEFFKSQETLGDRLRQVGLGDLATNEILGEVLGTGKSVAAVLGLVNDVFMAIDNAPEQLKKDLQVVAPGIDRTSIAKALLLGKRGAEDLQKQIKEVSVLSAAKSQGVGLTNALAADYAARGFDYAQSLEGFGTVAKGAAPLQKLTEISNQTKSSAEAAQQTLMKSIFEKDVKAQEQLRLEAEKEAARFSGGSGTMGSRSLASRNRANRII